VLLVVLVLFVWGLHAVVFGHPRYRLPLTPVLALYAGAAVAGAAWHKLRDGWRVALWPMTVIAALALSWAVQFAIRDLGHLKRLAGGA
jgi:hypothetical protein